MNANTSSIDPPTKEDNHSNSCIDNNNNTEAFVRYPKNNGSALKEQTVSNKDMRINNSNAIDGHNTSVI